MTHTRSIVFTACSIVALTGAAAASPAVSHRPAFVEVDGVWQRSPDGCGTPQIVVADPSKPVAPAVPGIRTIFLNRNGGTFHLGGATDAATNNANSQIIPGNNSQTFTIPPLETSGFFNWANIVSCVKGHFTKYNLRVVEAEPLTGNYVEAIVGGDGTEIGFGPNELFGIASADNFCNVTERGIAFSFSETHRQVPRHDEELCATIAHEVGHLLALEHEQLPTDLLSYVLINDSGSKAFVDQSSGCGTSPQQPSSCSCGASSTNSASRLSQFIGLRDTETVPPMLTVTTPSDVLTVPPTFDVVVTATDDKAMSDVTALVDNVDVGSDTMPEGNVYTVTAHNIAEGEHTLSVIATDAAGNTAKKDIPIIVKKSATGDTCVANEACTGGICAQTTDGNFCTQLCDMAANSCPENFDCTAVSGSNICVPVEGGGCGCSSGTNPGPLGLFGLLGVTALLLRRRRR